jgi:hypothetical protein
MKAQFRYRVVTAAIDAHGFFANHDLPDTWSTDGTQYNKRCSACDQVVIVGLSGLIMGDMGIPCPGKKADGGNGTR